MLTFFPASAYASSLKIISLSPWITREIYDMGAGVMLSGVTSYCPQEGTRKQIIGNLKPVAIVTKLDVRGLTTLDAFF